MTVTETVLDADLAEGMTEPDDSPQEPRNPVPIVKLVKGCTIEEGTDVGDVDINGNRYASCSFFDNQGTEGTNVTVRTYPGDPEIFDTNPGPATSDDSNKVIVGEDFRVTITGDWPTYSKDVDPNEIAEQVGGTFVAPQ